MSEQKQHKQQLILKGAICRAQILNASSMIRHEADIKVLAGHAKEAAFSLIKDKLSGKQKELEKIIPVVLDGVLTASSVSTRYMRKPVLYGAMILGAISVLPRFFKGRKSNDQQ